MISPHLAKLMIHTITLEKTAATAVSGDKTFGSAVSIAARVEHDVRNVRDGAGREVVSQTRIFAKPTDTEGRGVVFEPTDRITLPAGFSPQTPAILSIQRVDDADGIHHWEIRA